MSYKPLTKEDVYKAIKDSLEEMKKQEPERKLILYAFSDENGRCKWMEDFDKAMKEQANKYLDNGSNSR